MVKILIWYYLCSWFTYASMLRIYKHYAFKLEDSNAGMYIIVVLPLMYVLLMPHCTRLATEVMSFSSYPAYLSSLDDFYIMDRFGIHACVLLFMECVTVA